MPNYSSTRPPGQFEAVSRSKRDLIIRTRHSTVDAARKRLSGVRRHTNHALYEHITMNGQPERVRLAWTVA